VQNFVKAYGDKFKDDSGSAKVPDALATLAYDATNLLMQAITEAGSEDTAKVKDSLAKDKVQRRFRPDHLRLAQRPGEVRHHPGGEAGRREVRSHRHP